MERSDIVYQTYLKILKRELISAMGCTEPVALAYCAAVARATLGSLPDRIIVEASGNIIKNVKSVVVPNTGGQRGIPAAVCIGVLAGDEKAGLQVLSRVTSEDKERLLSYMKETPVEVKPLISENLLDMIVTVHAGDSSAAVRIANEHTNIIRIEKDGKVLQENKSRQEAETDGPSDDDLLKVDKIWDFACTCAIEDVKEFLDRQIAQNTAIAEEGMRRDYGANIGKVLLKAGNDVRTRARAYAAAGSDARMNGSELPVVICSGSGNQGLTASLPVIVYARELHADREKLYRALLISTLITIHLKSGIGRLSAYCGAVSAGAVISWAETKTISPTPSSIAWPSPPASSVTGQNPPAPPKSPRRWKRAFSATRCTGTVSSFMPGTGWWSRVWKTPSTTSAAWPGSACAEPMKRSSV